jgi:hypothetical protein
MVQGEPTIEKSQIKYILTLISLKVLLSSTKETIPSQNHFEYKSTDASL